MSEKLINKMSDALKPYSEQKEETDNIKMNNLLHIIEDLESFQHTKRNELGELISKYCDFEIDGISVCSDGVSVIQDINLCLVSDILNIIKEKGRCSYDDFLKHCV